ncbi:MAG: deoxynucleoside kinase [Bacteroidota bacterium]|jgi:deoxyadenosine/deoxycytidine kinase|nr:deoxynucleoside kinase [Bacteroidota bacterium]
MFICIEGNIGSGKTTLAKELSKRLKAAYLPEKFEENTLLPLFYQDRKTYAFPTEYSFLIERQKQLSNHFKLLKKGKTTVSDFHFDKCLCFAKTNLEDDDYHFFKKHFKPLRKTLPTPDLVVYLDTTTELLEKNIHKRGREIEKSLKKTYLARLKKTLDKYYMVNGNINTVVLSLTIKEYTAATLEACCKEILEVLENIKNKSAV